MDKRVLCRVTACIPALYLFVTHTQFIKYFRKLQRNDKLRLRGRDVGHAPVPRRDARGARPPAVADREPRGAAALEPVQLRGRVSTTPQIL